MKYLILLALIALSTGCATKKHIMKNCDKIGGSEYAMCEKLNMFGE